jgi:hypothetical protein
VLVAKALLESVRSLNLNLANELGKTNRAALVNWIEH